MIHSVDSLKLAQEINKRAQQHNLTMDILIQVNSAMEESKFGITTEETGQMIKDILDTCDNVRIKGLMCIAPFEDDPEDTVWVKDYFIPNAVEYGCKTIYFIIDKDNSLANELKGQEEDSKDKISFKYIYALTDIKEL